MAPDLAIVIALSLVRDLSNVVVSPRRLKLVKVVLPIELPDDLLKGRACLHPMLVLLSILKVGSLRRDVDFERCGRNEGY